jgi:lipooligosaccharide transport system permease protein
MVSGSLMLIVAIFMGVFPVSIINLLLLLILMAFVGVLFASIAMIVTSFAPNFDFFSYYTELIMTPMLFFSGVFFPLDKFPVWMQNFANFLPLTHAVNISRAIFYGQSSPGLTMNFLVLMILEIIAFYLGVKLMKRRLIK